MSRVCIPCSTYVLTFYLLMSSQKEIDNTFFFFAHTIPENIRKKFPNSTFIDLKEFFLSNFSSYPHIISASTQNENAPQEISFLRSILYIILQTEPPFLAQQMPLPTPLLSEKIFRFCHKSVPAVQSQQVHQTPRRSTAP